MTTPPTRSADTATGGSATGQPIRRVLGFEREYRCSGGHQHRSWGRIRCCPDCGEPLAVAVIRRMALA